MLTEKRPLAHAHAIYPSHPLVRCALRITIFRPGPRVRLTAAAAMAAAAAQAPIHNVIQRTIILNGAAYTSMHGSSSTGTAAA